MQPRRGGNVGIRTRIRRHHVQAHAPLARRSVGTQQGRAGRIVDGSLVAGYLYRPDGLIAAETDGGGNVVARFAYDEGRLVLVQRDGRDLLVTTDQLGSPVLLVDAATGSSQFGAPGCFRARRNHSAAVRVSWNCQ